MKISVIIPFYNLERYVRECLDSVVAAVERRGGAGQGMDSISVEVICIDDGSSDATGALLDVYSSAVATRAPTNNQRSTAFNLRVLHQKNGGEGSARNAGLAAATGEWVTFLDGDDVWLPTMLTAFAHLAARHPEADILGFRFMPFEDGKTPPVASATVGHDATANVECEYDVRREIPAEAVLDLGVFPTFFRREKFADIAFSALPLGADRLYVAQCPARAGRIVMSPVGVHGYRVRAGSMARAAWNERKIRSMIDFAAGSLAAFAASGRRVGRKGAAYLGDVLLSVTPKQIRRMPGDKAAVRRYWIDALAELDGTALTGWQRLKRRGRLLAGR